MIFFSFFSFPFFPFSHRQRLPVGLYFFFFRSDTPGWTLGYYARVWPCYPEWDGEDLGIRSMEGALRRRVSRRGWDLFWWNLSLAFA